MDRATGRAVLRLLSNGIYVLTSRSSDRYGAATVTWLSQASFKPPMIMMAIRRRAASSNASSRAARRRLTSSTSVNRCCPQFLRHTGATDQ